MLRKSLLIAFLLGIAIGVGLTLLSSKLTRSVTGFTLKEAQAKLGRRVKLKENAIDEAPQIINTGIVAYIDERCGERELVIDWDKLLPGMKHRITSINRDTYNKVVIEE